MLDDKSILVTGGTGSFGRKFVETVLARYKVRRLVVFSRDELKQFEMSQDFPESKYPCMRYFLGDVRDNARLMVAMRGIDFVVHAAAMKQVPAAEANPMECIKTNIHGAENVIDAAIANEVEKVIGLSTDKAANPINLYGATKLVSDKLLVAANNVTGGHRTRFSVVRYGNVAGSRGSVIPVYRKLLAQGARELPVTDVQMTRFWITLEQGVEFVLQSFARMHAGEIFVPKIPSVRILDLVGAMGPQIQHRVIGIRPGEKLHEVMCPKDDAHRTYEFSDHYVIAPTIIDKIVDYSRNLQNQTGKAVSADFEYSSNTNPEFLSVAQLQAFLQ